MITKRFTSLPDDARRIRTEVFVEEQGFKVEFDETDNTAVHLVMYDGDTAAAVCRYFFDKDHGCFMIGRVAVSKQYRGKHLGSEIMKEAEKFIVADGGTTLAVSAQCRVREFYEKLGYTACSAEYLDEYCPHILMSKNVQ